jgi:hypothetical protein
VKRHQNIQDKWNGDKKWDKWSNKSIWRALLTWLLFSSALLVPAFVINAILPTLFMLAKYGPILLRFACAALALCALIPFEVIAWRMIKGLFSGM